MNVNLVVSEKKQKILTVEARRSKGKIIFRI